ncbi:MAG: hypothetical protein JSR87_04235 [Proteobacteria bacterium]|nr:hypothetical protein [Pseudomonadota bacterium]MBS0572094.1 hypothetical protein [Pseudomonadota bacterium]
MTATDPDDDKGAADRGVILRAANGDVIRYDPTGLVMRLSDKVVADIAARLSLAAPVAEAQAEEFADLPGDLDAWDIHPRGDWLHFMARLPGRQGIRGFRRHRAGGAVVADGRGPLLGILGIGGARAALGAPQAQPGFPFHILSPADDIGAVGHAGVELATPRDQLEPIRDLTHEALIADWLLAERMERGHALPLFMVRVETDESPDARALATGRAVDNLEQAVLSLIRAAERLGTHAKLLAVTLDFALEDVSGDATAYRDGMIALMEAVTVRLGQLGLARPLFLATFDCGTHRITESPALAGQWELSWNHGEHTLVYAAPGYMFAQDETARLTDRGRAARAAMCAAALTAGVDWQCPVIHLAEAAGDTIRLTCASRGALVLDADDPFGAGDAAGFALRGAPEGQKILRVEIDEKDPKSVILHCARPVAPQGLSVTYAYGAEPGAGPFPPNAGRLRDDWTGPDVGGQALRRWALPALLPVTPGGGRE